MFMTDKHRRNCTLLALFLLLIEAAVLCLPVFHGYTALQICRQYWQHGQMLSHIVIPWLLLVCTIISICLLFHLKVHSTDKIPEVLFASVSANASENVSNCGTLLFLTGSLEGKSFPLPAYTNVFLGRSSQYCQIVINSSDISRRHASVCYHASRHTFVITDYSANGTYTVDGERLIPNTSIEVPDGSIFSIGNRKTSFRLSANREDNT